MKVLRALRSRSRRSHEGGFTLVELMVTMAVMSIIATAIMGVAVSVLSTTVNVTDRRDVFTDARFALDQITKDLRAGESVGSASDADTVSVETYRSRDGDAISVVWRAEGSSAPFTLQRSDDGGTTYKDVLDTLASNQLFTYTTHDGVTDEVTVALDLNTRTDTVPLTTDVLLRNAT
jgi:prepilin-type N-terminal cleavage/methylation domain-containing protein